MIEKINKTLHSLATCTEGEEHVHGHVEFRITLEAELIEIDMMIAELAETYGLDTTALDQDMYAYYAEALQAIAEHKLAVAKKIAIATIEAQAEMYTEKYSEFAKEIAASVATQTAAVNSITLADYELDEAIAKVESYGAVDFIVAQFEAIVNQ